jgi:hypothetical protein
MRGRFHQLVCQVAIIGQQQQAFAVEVEASDRIQPRLAAQQLHHRGPALWIRHRGYVSTRFVQRHVLVTLGPVKQFVLHANRVSFGISFGAQFRNSGAIY